jgi:hypothetical protein
VRNIVSWIILVVLAVSFVVLAQTAGSSSVAMAVAALGFFFVLGLWFLYREFSLHGSLSRAISVGDHWHYAAASNRPSWQHADVAVSSDGV